MFEFFTRKREKKRLWSALANYPEYAPPHRGALDDAFQAEENFAYFLQEKEKRLVHLAKFLAGWGVSTQEKAGAIDAMGKWLYTYGGYLVENRYSRTSLSEFDPPWQGEFVGLNCLYDIGIFIGDYLIEGIPGAKWDVFIKGGLFYGEEKQGYLHPCVYGLRRKYFGPRDPLFVQGKVYDCCASSRRRLRGQSTKSEPWDGIDDLSNQVTYWLGSDDTS